MKLVFYLLCFPLLSFSNSSAQHTLRPNQTLQDNGQTLVSVDGTFEFGFFSPQSSTNGKRYIGLWYKNVPDSPVVWVANRDNPITNSSSSATHYLIVTENGNVVILGNRSETPIWSSNSRATNPILQLLETGNLVVRDGGESGKISWQSFDHPLDTQIAGMKLGCDLKTGQDWHLNSWTSLEDPATGNFTYEIDPRIPQLVQRGGTEILFRSAPWDGVRFGGDPPLRGNPLFRPVFIYNDTHAYYTFENVDNSTVTRFWVSPSGSIQQLRWNHGSRSWVPVIISLQKDECDAFNRCGPNGFCDTNSNPVCGCATGFVPRAPQDWTRLDWSGGCGLRTPLNCSAARSNRFRKFSRVKLPYGLEISVNRSVVERGECESICRRNCTCVAYSVARVVGCVVWFGDLLDIRVYSNGGQDLYVRMAASEFESNKDAKRRAVIVAVSIVLSGCLVILFLVGLHIIWKKKTSRSHASTTLDADEQHDNTLLEEDIELPSFGLDTFSNATNNFCYANKIGEGGFGPVYKGMLQNGQQIAVKRLSKDSGQGLREFKNEVILISKLQHRNLVRLLGCCIHKEERMLIYEYMPNTSLELYIFNQTRSSALDWRRRFDIIVGIARGLLYLHRDSRLRIIHRDLKASNILLDNEMNPKISDFGLARIFGGDQAEVNTDRIVGTYGYMSPEYAIDGHFSMKSDIFSFGVMVLEIVSGNKNRGFEHPDHELNLLGHAWKLWNEGKPMELIDVLMENVPVSEALRCVQVGLLCVQKRPEDRPLMSSVLFMLDSENDSLPQPKQPGFYVERVPADSDSSSSLNKSHASTEITITKLHGR